MRKFVQKPLGPDSKTMQPSKLEFKPIENTFSLKGHIYETLREGITSMNIYSDDAELKLDERQLSEQLGISRTPIREALARLEQEGLVTVIPRRGVFIVRKTRKVVRESIALHKDLDDDVLRVLVEGGERERGETQNETFSVHY